MSGYGRNESNDDHQFTLKVMINNHNTKVLFAEADSDFVDVLVSFLTMPLGKIVRVLNNHYGDSAPSIGKLTSLYNSLSTLDGDHFWTEGCKELLLNPTSSFAAECCKLKLDVSDTQPAKHFVCPNRHYSEVERPKISCSGVYYDAAKCHCGITMTKEVDKSQAANGDGGVFTFKTMYFIISDDLRILPNTTGFIQTLCNLGFTNADIGEAKIVNVGFSEIMHLLKGSLLSCTPLSDLIFNRRHVYYAATPRSEPGSFFHNSGATSNPNKKIIVKLMVHKSTKKVLFCQSEEDFIDFLCSLLTIPLGGVVCLLGGKTYRKCIDNLYGSIADPYFANEDIRKRLRTPVLPHGYISENPILPLSGESVSDTYSVITKLSHRPALAMTCYITLSSTNFIKGQGKYVKGPRMYNISDDLTVTSFSMASILSSLKEMKIPITDVKEFELEIRLEEALSILRASLTSTSALTNGLDISRMLTEEHS